VSGDPSPAVSVTIVLYNSEPLLPFCVEAIRPELESGFAELLAVDNASPDDSVAVLAKEAPTANVVRADRNLGFAGGANLAWPCVQGRYWMLLNPDATLAPGGLRRLVAWMDEHRDVGIASPAIADKDGGNRRSAAYALPSASLVMAEFFRLHKLLPRRLRARVFQGHYWTGGDNLNAGWVPGTAMIVRREAAERVGLLDGSFFLYGEDIDWCWRMRRAGWRVGYCAEEVVCHDESAASLRSYGRAGTLLRMARMELEAVRRARGNLRARAYAAALVLALGAEAIHPRRARQARARSSAWFRAWVTAALHPQEKPGTPE
jgi:N-acetylglucosaminyl-diphospho-decaprenol L-rhamnosyltransferase